jgi:hypothetical protein
MRARRAAGPAGEAVSLPSPSPLSSSSPSSPSSSSSSSSSSWNTVQRPLASRGSSWDDDGLSDDGSRSATARTRRTPSSSRRIHRPDNDDENDDDDDDDENDDDGEWDEMLVAPQRRQVRQRTPPHARACPRWLQRTPSPPLPPASSSTHHQQHEEQQHLRHLHRGQEAVYVAGRVTMLQFRPLERLLSANECRAMMRQVDSPLVFKLSYNDSRLVESLLCTHGLRACAHPLSSDFNVMWTGSNVRSHVYRTLARHQRVNHFPRTSEITRKDRLAASVQRMQQLYGVRHFDFIPRTFALPAQRAEFEQEFQRDKVRLCVGDCKK